MIKDSGHDLLGLGMDVTYQDADAAIVEYNKEQRIKAEIKKELKAELEEAFRVEKPAKVEEKDKDIDIEVDLALGAIELTEEEVDTEICFGVDASALAEDFEKERIKDVVKEVLPQSPVVVNVNTGDTDDKAEKDLKKIGFFCRFSIRFKRGVRRFVDRVQDLVVSILLSLIATTVLFFIVNCVMYMSAEGIKLSEAEKLREVAQYGWSQVVWVFTTKVPEVFEWIKRLCGVY